MLLAIDYQFEQAEESATDAIDEYFHVYSNCDFPIREREETNSFNLSGFYFRRDFRRKLDK